MSKQMGRPKLTTEELARVETQIPWDEDVALNALVAEAGVSKRTLLRLFISTGLRAYTDAWAAVMPSSAPAGSARRQ